MVRGLAAHCGASRECGSDCENGGGAGAGSEGEAAWRRLEGVGATAGVLSLAESQDRSLWLRGRCSVPVTLLDNINPYINYKNAKTNTNNPGAIRKPTLTGLIYFFFFFPL